MLSAVEDRIAGDCGGRHLHFAQVILSQQLVNRARFQHVNVAIFVREIEFSSRRNRRRSERSAVAEPLRPDFFTGLRAITGHDAVAEDNI